jgi:hypothetical protein
MRALLANFLDRALRYIDGLDSRPCSAIDAESLRAAGYEVLNDVTLNQTPVSFGDDEATRRVIAAVQSDGT